MPLPILMPMHRGTMRWCRPVWSIKENLASPIGNLADLVEGLGLGSSDIRMKDDFKEALDRSYSDLPEGSREELMKVAMMVKGHRGISVDELCSRLGWNFSKVSRTVTTLECDGFISVDLLQHCHPLAAKL